MHAEYLLVLAGCLVVTAPLEFVLGARVYRSPHRLAWAVLPVVIIFTGWDLLGIHRGHWDYSAARTTGVLLPGAIPVEELAFFVVIPICALLTYEAVGRILDRARRSGSRGVSAHGRGRRDA